MKPKKLKRAVIKEELVKLTGDYKSAILLQQMIYWSERVKDFDTFLKEERKRASNEESNQTDLTHGWIYKTSEELSDETMLNITPESTRKYLKKLINKGFLHERRNPKYKWDRTMQYRVDIAFIQEELNKNGYNLEGYATVKNTIGSVENTIQDVKNTVHTSKKVVAIPETTTETITETTTDISTVAHKNENIEQIIEIISYLNEKVGTSYRPESEKTKKLIKARLNEKYTVDDFKSVIDIKCRDWKNSTEWSKFLRPETLFSNKFESYLQQAPKRGEDNEDNSEALAYFTAKGDGKEVDIENIDF